jgi:hypothetical protein
MTYNKPKVDLLGEAVAVIQATGKSGMPIDAPGSPVGTPNPPPAYDLDE